MRLISARILGYGRLVDTKVNLDSKLIAFVGPNESGKTTFLKALAYLDEDRALSKMERSRGGAIADSTPVVTVRFQLSEDDRLALQQLDLQELPCSIEVSRRADGGAAAILLEPLARKATQPLASALPALAKAVERKTLQQLVSVDSVFGDAESEASRDFRQELSDLIEALRQIADDQGEGLDQSSLASRANELSQALISDSKADRLRDALHRVATWLERDDPTDAAEQILWRRTPDFVLFGDADRTLQSDYVLDDNLLANVPPALAHVVRMAELDLAATVDDHRDEDISRRESALQAANDRLRRLFAGAWKQANLSVKLIIDSDRLRVQIVEDGSGVTVFGERSAGLQMFVALVAFLATRDTKTPPILLIDEAENHLHIDAQADLVNMFISQDQAARVIYTTHSPACLPPDLGVGIRSVVPSPNNPQASEIHNSFWGNGGVGYSPLMIAMGAAAAAFTTARYVVLGEGATEMLMLPSLMRSATGLEILPYQVAPGLSEIPKDFYNSLDLEGAKVAYLVDADASGQRIKANLIKSGVPEDRIVTLPVPGLENVLPPTDYLDAVSALLAECNPGVSIPSLPKLGAPEKGSWAAWIKAWADKNGLVMPSKVPVANRIVEDGRAVPAEQFVNDLLEVHRLLLKALGIQS